MNQLTKEQAIKIAESEIWRDMTDEQIVKFQLFQKKLCMPFQVFHGAIEKVLGRAVSTCEFAYSENIKKEYLKEKQPPTFEEIVSLIPESKLILIDL